jgi:hypothetical protein
MVTSKKEMHFSFVILASLVDLAEFTRDSFCEIVSVT